MTQSIPPVPAAYVDLPGLGKANGALEHTDAGRMDNQAGTATGPGGRCAGTQHFAFVALAACMLLFFGLLRGLAKVPDDEIVKLAIWATGITVIGIYGRNVLIVIGRSVINGVARNNDR